jgi:predicted nucleic acid-binding protein
VTPEVATESVLAWFERHASVPLSISDWTRVEVASALALKVRSGQLSVDQSRSVRALIDTWTGDSLDVIAVERSTFEQAGLLLERPGDGLRAGDALHLAIARQAGHSLVTLDRTLAAAARASGLAVDVPHGEPV